MSIFLWHDKLRQEFISYYHFLQAKNSEELLQESEDALNYDEIDEEEIDEDYDDYLLEEWNNYVNGIWDNEYYVIYNVDKDTSNQLKLMVMVSLYEFVATNYECASDI